LAYRFGVRVCIVISAFMKTLLTSNDTRKHEVTLQATCSCFFRFICYFEI